MLTNDQYLAKTKAFISDFLQNNPSISTNPHIKWEALKCCVRGHTISFSLNKKKMLSAKQDNLENLIKHEELKFLFATTCQSSLIEQKIASFQNELNDLLENRTKSAIVRSKARWVEHGEKNTKHFLTLEKRSNA